MVPYQSLQQDGAKVEFVYGFIRGAICEAADVKKGKRDFLPDLGACKAWIAEHTEADWDEILASAKEEAEIEAKRAEKRQSMF